MKASDSETVINLSQSNFSPPFLSTIWLQIPRKNSRSNVRHSSILVTFHICSCLLLLRVFMLPSFVHVSFSFFCFCWFCWFFVPSLLFLKLTWPPSIQLSYPLWWHLPFIIISRLLLSQCSHPKCPSLVPNWRCLFHAQILASNSDPANVTAQEGGNASPAMNQTLTGTTKKERFVFQQAPASMRFNSESVSNEIDESEKQHEKHREQRI
jgi:hypothetical protein